MTTRNLQITIFETPPARRRGPGSGGGPGSDPGETYVMPPPGDPGETYVMPPPGDPGETYVMPPPGDPGETYVMPPPGDPGETYVMPPPGDPGETYVMPPPGSPSAGFPGFGPVPGQAGPFVTARYLPAAAAPLSGQVPVCCCPCDEKTPRTPEKPGVSPRDYSGFLIVRVAPGVEPLTVDSLWELAEAARLDGLRSVLELSLDEEEMAEAPPEDGAGGRDRGGRGEGRSPAGSREDGRPRGPIKRWWREKWRRETEEERPPEPEGVLVSRPLIDIPGRDRKGTLWAVRKLEETAARTSRFRPRHSLTRYWRVDLRPYSELLEAVLARFNELAEVDLAYRELRAIDTAHQGVDAVTGEALTEDQGYFDPAPVGIGAQWVKRHLKEVREPHLRVVDLEQGWHVNHEQLENLGPGTLPFLVYGENREDDEPGSGNHGTAVLGQLAAAGVGDFGVRGAATEIAAFHVASHYRERLDEPTRDNPFPGTNGHVAAAIVNCLVEQPSTHPDRKFENPLTKGDVLLLEIQRGRLPTEIDEADFDAIRLATALGIVVVEAAGNGNFNLDACIDPQTGRTLRRGAPGFVDSGAILVGAAFSALPHDRAPFSNYGSRVDCYGWGEGVTTCGYGDLAGTSTADFYTNTFSGTSSAAPLIAGAAALLQCLHLLRTANRLLPIPLRALLARRATGTPQGPNVGGHIGVMPNLDALTRGTLQLVPDVYIRRHPCDDGDPLGPGEEISSSPDIVVSGQELDAVQATAKLGEGPAANHPAPGDPAIPGVTTRRWLYLRMRNRGQGEGAAEAIIYESPTATLIPPERWRPVQPGAAPVGAPAGDVLAASAGVAWTPAEFPAPTPSWPKEAIRTYSLLAVFDRDGDPLDPHRALPPGEPYFDWRRYREFLRGPGVAWRNVHPIAPGARASLAFFLAGTPDRAREFDLEVLQRLPQGTTVRLHLPRGLAAKLLQRQPALGNGSGPVPLTLPQRRSTRFSRVRLPQGLCAPAWFEVAAAAGNDLLAGHSLAIRQLWQGEEVGRITWHVATGTP